MQTAHENEALAEGRLEDQPLAHLLLFVYQKGLTGTLVISPDNGAQRVGIRCTQGRVKAAQLADPETSLEDGLLPLCGLRDGSFGFYRSDFLQGSECLVTGALDPYTFLSRSVHEFARDDLVDALLERYGDTPIRMQPGRDIERLRLAHDQQVIIDLLRAEPASIGDLVHDAPIPAERARRTLYVLLTTRTAEPFQDAGSQTYRSRTHGSEEPGTPQGQSSTIRPAVGHDSGAGDSFAPKAPASDSAPPNATPSRRPAAWKVLAARASMHPGAAATPGGSSTMRTVKDNANSMGTAARLRQCEELAKLGKWEDATGTINALLEDDGENPDFLALQGWVLYRHARSLGQTDVPKPAVDAIRKALRIDPEQTRALYTKGLFYKQGDRLKEAFNCFRKAAKLDPKNVEAKREVQILRRRIDAKQ